MNYHFKCGHTSDVAACPVCLSESITKLKESGDILKRISAEAKKEQDTKDTFQKEIDLLISKQRDADMVILKLRAENEILTQENNRLKILLNKK